MNMPGVLARSLRRLLRTIVRPSLGLQVISVAVLMAVLGGGVVGLVVSHSARSALRDTILNNSLATADLAAVLSATYMSDAQAAVRELAGEPTLGAAVRDGDVRELNLDLERWSVQHPNITVVLNDLDGIILAVNSSDKTSLGQKRSSVDWVQAIATGQPYLAAPGLSTVSKTPRVQYGVPVADEAGVIRGVLTASIQLEALSSVITSINLGQNTRASLTDRQTGLILAHPDPSRILTAGSGKNLASVAMMAGERGVLEDTSSSGQRVLAAFGPVPGLPWGILIQQPSDDAFAPLDEMDRDVMRLVGATMVLAIALGAVLALRIGRPLQRLRATAEAMAGGDLDRRAGLDRQDEAGELGRAFDHMADRLQASITRANESAKPASAR